MTAEELNLQREIHEARLAASSVPHYLFLPRDARPQVREALIAFAASSGRQVLEAPGPTASEVAAAELAARDVPTVKADDNRAFLANLKEIAAGRAVVR